ncbi:hypothetical protein J6590_033190 [Homalodisca vitripennis]|nr:hypothetical protein J6590_033190 [Homalodisca vitripennis]
MLPVLCLKVVAMPFVARRIVGYCCRYCRRGDSLGPAGCHSSTIGSVTPTLSSPLRCSHRSELKAIPTPLSLNNNSFPSLFLNLLFCPPSLCLRPAERHDAPFCRDLDHGYV